MEQYRSLFRNRNFLFHWLAGAISNIGDFFNSLALVKILSEDPANLGLYMSLITVSKVLPQLVFGPVAGVLADRLPRKAIMVTADLARAGLVLALVFVEQPAAIIALVFGAAIAAAFFGPASSAMLPSLVKPDEMVSAGSLEVMTQRMAMLLGNGIGAAVLFWVGPHNVFYIDAASFLISALMLIAVVAPSTQRETSPEQSLMGGFVTDMKETVAFLREAPPVRNIVIGVAIASIGDSALSVLMVTFFTVALGMAPENLGFVWAVFAAASTIGALAIGALGGRIHWRHLFTLGAGYVWLTMVGSILAAGPISSTIFMGLVGLGSGGINVGLQAAIGELVPDQVRGRIFGAFTTLMSLVTVIGGLSAGPLSDRFGPGATMLGFSTAYLATCIFAFFSFRRMKTQPSPGSVAG